MSFLKQQTLFKKKKISIICNVINFFFTNYSDLNYLFVFKLHNHVLKFLFFEFSKYHYSEISVITKKENSVP